MTAAVHRIAAPSTAGAFFRHRPCVELVPVWPGEFARWVRLCGALRFGWCDVGLTAGYRG